MATSIERVSKFEGNLIIAFDKMIRGINIELSKEYRDKAKRCTNGNKLERWWFIQSIGADETLNLCSSSQSIIEGIKLKEVVL